jgi:hypothetical protein
LVSRGGDGHGIAADAHLDGQRLSVGALEHAAQRRHVGVVAADADLDMAFTLGVKSSTHAWLAVAPINGAEVSASLVGTGSVSM